MGTVNPRVSGNYNAQFSPAQLKALDKTPIYTKDFPKAGAYPLSSVAPGFSTNNGWMLCRYVCTTLPTAGGSQYPSVVHDGTTQNTIGLRINNGASVVNSLNSFIKAANVVKSSERSQFATYANEIKTAILVWKDDGYQYIIVDDTFDPSTQSNARGFAVTTLQVGARNGGSDALVGSVLYLELGNTYLTPEEAAARLAVCRKPLVVATAGQSNMQNWEDGVETSAPEGRRGFTETIAAIYASAGSPGEVVQIHAAEGGSALFPENASELEPTEYWLENDGNPGPELVQFFQDVEKTGHSPDFVLWHQGEADAHTIDKVGSEYNTRATYKARLLRVFQHMRYRYPSVHILIGALGIRTTFTNTGGTQTIAEIQQELIDEYQWISYGWTCHDGTLNADGVHYQDASYLEHGKRAARSIQRLLGYPVAGGTLGPRLVSASRSGTSLTITIEHDAGTDFTPTTNISGFKYLNGAGADVALSSVNRASATTITATLASGVAGTLYYIYDSDSVTLANLLKDNGALTLPMRRGKVSVA